MFELRWLRPVLGIGITILFLWLFLRAANALDIWFALQQCSLSLVLFATFALAVDYLVRILRWWRMLKRFESKLRLYECFRPYLVSIALNNLLPLRAGDAYRVFGFRERPVSSKSRIFGTLIIERILDLMVLSGFFLYGLLDANVILLPITFMDAAALFALLGLLTTIGLIFLGPQLPALMHNVCSHRFVAHFPWISQTLRAIESVGAAIAQLGAWNVVAELVILTLISWILEGAVFLIIASGMGLAIAPFGAWFSLATGTLSTLIPSAPGYLGTFDYFALLGFSAYGAPNDTAAAAVVVIHAILWLPLTVVGTVYYFLPATHPSQPNRRSEKLDKHM